MVNVLVFGAQLILILCMVAVLVAFVVVWSQIIKEWY